MKPASFVFLVVLAVAIALGFQALTQGGVGLDFLQPPQSPAARAAVFDSQYASDFARYVDGTFGFAFNYPLGYLTTNLPDPDTGGSMVTVLMPWELEDAEVIAVHAMP